jgi:peptide/nickel transport system substrate-binding protein
VAYSNPDVDRLLDELEGARSWREMKPVLSYTWGADRAIEPWPYSSDEALRLLESRGYRRREADGVLERDGEPLRLTLTTNAGNRLRESVQVKIQEQLGRVGVEVELQPLEMRTFVHRNLSGEFDAYVGGWSVSGRVLRELFGSESTPPTGANVVAYSNPDVDRLLDELEGARSWREMKPVLSYTFLYEMRRLAAAGPRLRGVSIDHPLDPLAHLERDWVVQ